MSADGRHEIRERTGMSIERVAFVDRRAKCMSRIALGVLAAAAAAVQAAEDVTALDEIVVTARKRSESVETVPITIDVLSGPQLSSPGDYTHRRPAVFGSRLLRRKLRESRHDHHAGSRYASGRFRLLGRHPCRRHLREFIGRVPQPPLRRQSSRSPQRSSGHRIWKKLDRGRAQHHHQQAR